MTVESSPVKFTPIVPGQPAQEAQAISPASELEFKPGMAIHSLRELPVRWDKP
ncbi:MAG: hypothetical protein JO345_17110 [Streptosporangiaceae bacterium]|nr:hypothetical protein [Streptosporangiaceae bacterium]